MIKFYCVKCRTSREVGDDKVQKTKLKNGRPAAKGTCPVCGTGMFKILSAREA